MAASALEGPSPVNRAKRAARTSACVPHNAIPSKNVERTISAAVDVLLGGAAADGAVELSLVDHPRNWVSLAMLTRASRFAYRKTAATIISVIAYEHQPSSFTSHPEKLGMYQIRPCIGGLGRRCAISRSDAFEVFFAQSPGIRPILVPFQPYQSAHRQRAVNISSTQAGAHQVRV